MSSLTEMTYVVNQISRVSSQSQKFSRSERSEVDIDGLNEGHDDRSCGEPNPFLVNKGERFRSIAENNARCDTKGEQKGRKCCAKSHETISKSMSYHYLTKRTINFV